MDPECEAFRDEHAGRPVDPADVGETAREHLAGCGDCRAWVARRGRIVQALTALPRVEVPAELDGRAVAALFSGQRQDRAVRSVIELGAVAPPEDLDQRLHRALVGADRVPRLEAPAELASRVDRDLRDPEARLQRLFDRVGPLERLAAPDELDGRVARDLAARPSPRLRVARWALAAAAGLVAVLGSGRLRSSSPAPEPEALSFRIVPITEPQELSGMARALILPATGGILGSGGDEEL